MARWRRAEWDVECGGCRLQIPRGAPLALVTTQDLIRCEYCAFTLGVTGADAALGPIDAAAEARARLQKFVPQRRFGFAEPVPAAAGRTKE